MKTRYATLERDLKRYAELLFTLFALLTTSLLLLTGCVSKRDQDPTVGQNVDHSVDTRVENPGGKSPQKNQVQENDAQENQVQKNQVDEIVVATRQKRELEYAQQSTVADMANLGSPVAVMPEMARVSSPPHHGLLYPSEPVNRENYDHLTSNPVKLVSEEPVSTFSIDVDTGAYANVRRMLNDGHLPPQDAVRVEELINYFSYNYPTPRNSKTPFSINTELAQTPWNENSLLLQVGLQGYQIEAEDRPATNLVFLIDVSGSMHSADKLPLLKRAFRLLTREMNENDRVSMVVYAGATGIVLEPTPGDQQATILSAIDNLRSSGSTNGAAGIQLAYQMAEQAFIEGGINRVVLATDGDFNVGTVNFEALIDIVEEKRNNGVSLTTLGFGTGNYNDHLMEQLADNGNGNYAYIDSLSEARKVLVEELSATLHTIAKDVKIQIEFNPNQVAEYRLIGYENRILRREDFNNDKIDAGEIGAGHTVTALYEIVLNGSDGRLIDPLRYGRSAMNTTGKRASNELAFVRLRYKEPDADKSQLIEQVVQRNDIQTVRNSSDELRFAAAVAAFGQRLRGGDYLQDFDYEEIRKLAAGARADDEHGYRGEFIGLVKLADTLATENLAKHEQPRDALAAN